MQTTTQDTVKHFVNPLPARLVKWIDSIIINKRKLDLYPEIKPNEL